MQDTQDTQSSTLPDFRTKPASPVQPESPWNVKTLYIDLPGVSVLLSVACRDDSLYQLNTQSYTRWTYVPGDFYSHRHSYPNMDPPDNYQTTYNSKTKIVVFYSLIVCGVQDCRLYGGAEMRLLQHRLYFFNG